MNFISMWLDNIPTEWKIFIAVIVVLGLLAQKLSTVRELWLNYRHGVSNLVFEKQRLEILKIKYEIEVLRKSHDLDEIEALERTCEESADSLIVASNLRRTPSVRPMSPMWRWMLWYPVLASIVIGIGRIVFGFCTSICALGLVLVPISSPDEPDAIVGALILFGPLCYVFYRGYRRVKALRRQLESHRFGQ